MLQDKDKGRCGTGQHIKPNKCSRRWRRANGQINVRKLTKDSSFSCRKDFRPSFANHGFLSEPASEASTNWRASSRPISDARGSGLRRLVGLPPTASDSAVSSARIAPSSAGFVGRGLVARTYRWRSAWKNNSKYQITTAVSKGCHHPLGRIKVHGAHPARSRYLEMVSVIAARTRKSWEESGEQGGYRSIGSVQCTSAST